MASCHTHAPLFPTFIPLLLPLHALLFPRSPHLFFSSYSLLLSSASTDADARNGRRGCSYRPTRMLVSTDADDRLPPLAIITFRILKIIMRAKAVAMGLFISDYIEPTAPMPSIRSTSAARSFHNTIYIRLRLVE